ncbi:MULTISPECIES: hypothetical protein [Mammaliicoccus]|uniref:Uncharacterized protein n=1 Tax=Mammaliicoccus sciuri TaxID=1296 RepID=A0AAW5LJC9_MAMSC|nr:MULTISPECIES: hypothetical protein [Mammaliicoccus]MBG9209753.1 hypothetical protein [Mammaliicoccus sciuri]MCD5140468.1 hypothetical protein [Mammaliicoccus sciuri]MCP1286599.1 hypothetical protein [Mammaliicoccus sciuri]MCQ9302881.1 hypothetical protein [Mammaliicoccus sciuri]MDO0955789.1 hypothetical protein [Mammaliicoccus sciuri]
MNFKGFEIEVNYNGNYDFFTCDNKALILNQDGEISISFKVIGDSISITSTNYDTEVIISAATKKVEINVPDPMEFG